MGSIVVAALTFFQPNLSITRAQLIIPKRISRFLNTHLSRIPCEASGFQDQSLVIRCSDLGGNTPAMTVLSSCHF